jgi:hypothetical protein
MNMANIKHIDDGVNKSIDKNVHTDFLFHYQKSILLALEQSGKITIQQYELCIEKLTKQMRKG